MAEEFKIYTKGGDKGETSLIGGTRVPKFHPRIEAYGTVDELNSFIGLIADQNIDKHYKDILLIIQERLFVIESLLAVDPDSQLQTNLPDIETADIELLENEIDLMNENLPELRAFILPGGHPAVSYCHIARTVCRRAERLIIRLSRTASVDSLILQYLNRLSDYFFVLARQLSKDFKVHVREWKPGK